MKFEIGAKYKVLKARDDIINQVADGFVGEIGTAVGVSGSNCVIRFEHAGDSKRKWYFSKDEIELVSSPEPKPENPCTLNFKVGDRVRLRHLSLTWATPGTVTGIGTEYVYVQKDGTIEGKAAGWYPYNLELARHDYIDMPYSASVTSFPSGKATPTPKEHSMQPFLVVVMLKPTKNEAEDGKQVEIIVPLTCLMATSATNASVQAGRLIPEAHAEAGDRLEVAVMPFRS